MSLLSGANDTTDVDENFDGLADFTPDAGEKDGRLEINLSQWPGSVFTVDGGMLFTSSFAKLTNETTELELVAFDVGSSDLLTSFQYPIGFTIEV